MVKKKKLAPLKAIKMYCKESCSAGDMKSWRECTAIDCPLYEYRMGASAKRKGIGGNPNFKKKSLT